MLTWVLFDRPSSTWNNVKCQLDAAATTHTLHIISFFTVQKTICCNLISSAPDDGRLYPKHVKIRIITYLLHYLLTYLLTAWCRVLLEKLTGLQLVKKFPAFHGTRRFITALTSLRQLSLSWASPIQSIYPYTTSWTSALIISTHLRLGLPSGLFPSGFPTKTLHTTLSLPKRATCPAHLVLLDFITRTILGEEYKSFSSSLCNLLHSPVTSSLLGPNILLNTMFSNTLSFLSSSNVSNQVSHPCKTTGKIIVLCILIFKFLNSNLEDKRQYCQLPNKNTRHILKDILILRGI